MSTVCEPESGGSKAPASRMSNKNNIFSPTYMGVSIMVAAQKPADNSLEAIELLTVKAFCSLE